jgi:hypothetical protein
MSLGSVGPSFIYVHVQTPTPESRVEWSRPGPRARGFRCIMQKSFHKGYLVSNPSRLANEQKYELELAAVDLISLNGSRVTWHRLHTNFAIAG